ncbi:hypothetical protein N7495_001083 [Penicillium taxi]|uniref:uncharacterized protein n=1 Tax=Penicillium taxi TaxID=168475 RepID=UPI0025454C4B|nr:uncharacterized protein N7495_001083 [Penicillium taxi]KAJ5908401.1 hypothetical protein N7495_001083 [Penicillium taxi]
MSRFGGKKGKKLPGAEFSWEGDAGGEADNAPTPLFPAYYILTYVETYVIPTGRVLNHQEKNEVAYFRSLREQFHEGPYYSLLKASAINAKKGSTARATMDPFTSMPTYSARYQKKHRVVPHINPKDHEYILKFFPRNLWPIIQPSFRPNGEANFQSAVGTQKRGFEDDEDEGPSFKLRKSSDSDNEDDVNKGDDEEGAGDGELLDGDEDAEEEIEDNDFEDDENEMGGDYDAEQYFDAGGDDEEDFGEGGGGDEDTY